MREETVKIQEAVISLGRLIRDLEQLMKLPSQASLKRAPRKVAIRLCQGQQRSTNLDSRKGGLLRSDEYPGGDMVESRKLERKHLALLTALHLSYISPKANLSMF